MQRTYLAIDLKSYYASAECAARHLDPLTTNLVVADSSRTEKTICLAVSPSLKTYGIPGRARLFEVVQKVKEVNANRLREAVRLRKAVYKEDEIASEGRDHLKGNRIELSEEGKEVLNQKISQLWKGQEITIKYFTDGYYENVAGVLDAVDVINKELRIYTGFINDTGKELPTIIAFEDILEIGVNMT